METETMPLEIDADILQSPEPKTVNYRPSSSTGIYYDGRNYYYPRERLAGYIRLTQTDLRRELKRMGYRAKPRENEALSEVDVQISSINRKAFVERAGPLAGYRCGIVNDTKTAQRIGAVAKLNIRLIAYFYFPVYNYYIHFI